MVDQCVRWACQRATRADVAAPGLGDRVAKGIPWQMKMRSKS